MTRLTKVLFTAALSVAAMAGTALADDPPAGGEGGGGDAAGGAGGDASGGGDAAGGAAGGAMDAAADAGAPSGLTIGKGKILIGGETVNINLSKDAVAKPISFAPSVYYGVNEKLQVGIVHNGGATGLTPSPVPGAGVCISSKEDGCEKVYNNVGLDVLFGLAAGKFSAAAHGGLEFIRLSDPMFLDIRLGVLGRYMVNEKISVAFDPAILVGVTERDAGNKQFINVPVYLWFAATPQINAGVGTGISGPTDHFGDFYQIPLVLSGTYAVNPKIGVGLDFSLDNVGGKKADGVGAADARSLGIRFGYAL